MKLEPDKDDCEDQDENTVAKSLINEIIEETEKEEVKPLPSRRLPTDKRPTDPVAEV